MTKREICFAHISLYQIIFNGLILKIMAKKSFFFQKNKKELVLINRPCTGRCPKCGFPTQVDADGYCDLCNCYVEESLL